MRKIAIIALLLVIVCAVASFAQPRIDLGLDVPFYFGIKFDTGSGSSSIGDFSQFAFLFPEVSGSYVFNLGLLNVGIGIRMMTFIIETVGWPNAFVEVNLDPLVLSAEIGGGIFFVFGLYNNAGSGAIVLGDIAAAFKFTNWFRAGVGVFAVGSADPSSFFAQSNVIPFAVYAFGKFTFDMGPKAESSD